jgi:opacity protein-like surface antigen
LIILPKLSCYSSHLFLKISKKYEKSFFRKNFKIKKYKNMLCSVISIYKDANIKAMARSFIMIKKLGIVLLCTTLGSTLYARDDISKSRPFIGVELGYATMKADALNYFDPSVYPDYESSDIEYGVRIGARKDDWRTTVVVNYLDTTNDNYDQNYLKGSIEIDYMFTVTEGGDSALKPFLGLNAGYISYETGDTPNKIDPSGFTYGGQIGVVYSVTEKVDLDLKYRYTAGANVEDDSSDRNRVQGIGSIVFGINYLY